MKRGRIWLSGVIRLEVMCRLVWGSWEAEGCCLWIVCGSVGFIEAATFWLRSMRLS
jgi:hypothetical protein